MKHHIALGLSLTLALSGCPALSPTAVKDTGKKGKAAPIQVADMPGTPAGGAGVSAQDTLRAVTQNGAPTELIGKVKLISDKGLGIISNNTASLVSNNGGGLISDKGLGVVSNGGNNYRMLATAPQESLLADAVIEVTDAEGRVLVDENNKPLTATTDQQGNYSFKAVLPPETVLLRVRLFPNGGAKGAGGQLRAIVPKATGTGARTTSIDTASSLGTAYVLQKYVKNNQAVLNKLPGFEAEALQREMEAARVHMAAAVPTYQPEEMVAVAEDLRAKVPALDLTLKRIEAILLAGQANLGNGLKATQVSLAIPQAVAMDAEGNMYIAETSAGRVRKVTPDGVISTYMGVGATGWPAGADPIVTQQFDAITAMAFGPDGALYLVEGYLAQVRKFTRDGKVTRVAGNGNRLTGALNVPATSTSLNFPVGLGFGKDGVVYIGEISDQTDDGSGIRSRVLKVGADGLLTEVPTPAEAPAGADYTGIIELADGTLMVLEAVQNKLYRKRPGGSWEVVATGYKTQYQSRIALKPNGNVLITNTTENNILECTPDGTLSVVVGGGTNPDATDPKEVLLNAPSGLFWAPDGTLVFTEAGSGLVRTLKDGKVTLVAGTTGLNQTGDASTLAINQPGGVTIDPQGRIVFTEVATGTIKRLENGKVTVIAGTSSGFSGDGGPATAAQFKRPVGLIYHNNELYVVDSDNQRVRKIDANGVLNTVVGNGEDEWLAQAKLPALDAQMHSPLDIAIGPDGLPYFTDTVFNYVARLTADGQFEMVVGTTDGKPGDTGNGGPAKDSKLSRPLGITFDKDGNLYIADGGNFRVQKVGKDGKVSTVAGLPTLNENLGKLIASGGKANDGDAATQTPFVVPTEVAFDGAGNLYVAEMGTSGLANIADLKDQPLHLLPKVTARIRKITPDGKVYLVAGMGAKLLSEAAGDNSLGIPVGMTFDRDGRLILTDSGTNQLKMLPKEAL